jgi:hypothetical protein
MAQSSPSPIEGLDGVLDHRANEASTLQAALENLDGDSGDGLNESLLKRRGVRSHSGSGLHDLRSLESLNSLEISSQKIPKAPKSLQLPSFDVLGINHKPSDVTNHYGPQSLEEREQRAALISELRGTSLGVVSQEPAVVKKQENVDLNVYALPSNLQHAANPMLSPPGLLLTPPYDSGMVEWATESQLSVTSAPRDLPPFAGGGVGTFSSATSDAGQSSALPSLTSSPFLESGGSDQHDQVSASTSGEAGPEQSSVKDGQTLINAVDTLRKYYSLIMIESQLIV